jgi:hypothetical protein
MAQPNNRGRASGEGSMPDDDVLLLTEIVAPSSAQWSRANKIFGHRPGCRCTTCRLAAELAWMIGHASTNKRESR